MSMHTPDSKLRVAPTHVLDRPSLVCWQSTGDRFFDQFWFTNPLFFVLQVNLVLAGNPLIQFETVLILVALSSAVH